MKTVHKLEHKNIRIRCQLKANLFVKETKSYRMIDYSSVQRLKHNIGLIYEDIERTHRLCSVDYLDQKK